MLQLLITIYMRICRTLKISSPKLNDVLNSLKENGYLATRTHFKPTAIKTNAPVDEIKRIILILTSV